jgi:glycosyltransferase involved in cell wall biosynthesis
MHYFKKADAIVALTKNDAKKWNIKFKNVIAIPNVVHLNNTGSYTTCVNHSIIFVGRMAQQKGLNSLIEIWKQIIIKYPDWKLNIFGDGEYKDIFIREIGKYDNRMSILYHAPETNIINEYCKNSIFMLTSEYEPFGLVIPEAMSCGLPVVSFDVPYGPSEIIHNGIDGFLIKPNNINDFVNKLSLLIENRELRCKMGKEAVKSSLKYSYNNIMPKWEQLFHSITHKM